VVLVGVRHEAEVAEPRELVLDRIVREDGDPVLVGDVVLFLRPGGRGRREEPGEHDERPDDARQARALHGSKGKTRFQSAFMSTTVQWRAAASSRALSSFPTCDVRSYAHSRAASVWGTIPRNRAPLPAAVHWSIWRSPSELPKARRGRR